MMCPQLIGGALAHKPGAGGSAFGFGTEVLKGALSSIMLTGVGKPHQFLVMFRCSRTAMGPRN